MDAPAHPVYRAAHRRWIGGSAWERRASRQRDRRARRLARRASRRGPSRSSPTAAAREIHLGGFRWRGAVDPAGEPARGSGARVELEPYEPGVGAPALGQAIDELEPKCVGLGKRPAGSKPAPPSLTSTRIGEPKVAASATGPGAWVTAFVTISMTSRASVSSSARGTSRSLASAARARWGACGPVGSARRRSWSGGRDRMRGTHATITQRCVAGMRNGCELECLLLPRPVR